MTRAAEQELHERDWHRRMSRPDMAWLPSWVKAEYLEYLARLTVNGPWDEATLDFDERIEFYEKILTNKRCATVWKTLEANRHAALEGLGLKDINQVEDLLTTAHSSYRWYSPNEAMQKKARDQLGGAIGGTAHKLSKLMHKLWLGSPEDERGYPTGFAGIHHDEVRELLTAIEKAAESWVTSDRFVHKPGAGDGRRRYFMCAMADWFESVYRQVDVATGSLRTYRFDNVVTALTNCLFTDIDGGVDQSTVTKVLDAASAARASK